MTEDKRELYLDNFEQRVMVRSLNDARTQLMQNEKRLKMLMTFC